MSDELQHVHATTESVASLELTPPHPPRVETPIYRRAHDFLIHEKDSPCRVCGVKVSTLHDPAQNTFGAKALETHHWPIERSLLDAVDPKKVHRDFSEVYDRPTLEAFVDSPRNLLVLCDLHHRSPERGIHHLLTQDFAIQPYLYDGYVVAANPADLAQDLNIDTQIEIKQGIETLTPGIEA